MSFQTNFAASGGCGRARRGISNAGRSRYSHVIHGLSPSCAHGSANVTDVVRKGMSMTYKRVYVIGVSVLLSFEILTKTQRRKVSLGHLALLSIALAMLVGCAGCGGNYMRPGELSNTFSESNENMNLDDLSLTIYYVDTEIRFRMPPSVDRLIIAEYAHKIVVGSERSEELIALLNQLKEVDLVPVMHELVSARVYYVFESSRDGDVFDVAIFGGTGKMFVNGQTAEVDEFFIDAIMPFLDERASQQVNGYLGR